MGGDWRGDDKGEAEWKECPGDQNNERNKGKRGKRKMKAKVEEGMKKKKEKKESKKDVRSSEVREVFGLVTGCFG